VYYLVMEHLAGEIVKGPLLKPANILVTKAGVKLLDFGLARALRRRRNRKRR
jgi:hypothetical protein